MTKISNLDELLDAAAKVFGEKGYANARLEDIAAEVGMLKGSLYYHVGSKAALLRLVRRRRFLEIAQAIEDIAALPEEPRARFRLAIHEQLRFVALYIAESPQWLRNPANPSRTAEEAAEDHELVTRLREGFRTIIADGVDDGSVSPTVDPMIFVLSVLGMCNWVSRWYEPDGQYTIDEIAEIQFDMLWQGIAIRAKV